MLIQSVKIKRQNKASKLSAKIKLTHKSMLTAVNIELISNIIPVQPKNPIVHVTQEKNVNAGRKFGAEARYSPKQATFTIAYDRRKSTLQSCAILFSPPISIKS